MFVLHTIANNKRKRNDMLVIDKLGEENLLLVLKKLFPQVLSITKKTFNVNGRRMIVDYYFELDSYKISVEFDGPTHYTRSLTQVRDINIKSYCKDNNINLVRIPYFFQITDETIPVLFGVEITEKYSLLGNVTSTYENGFIDEKCVLPGDFNPWGQKLFVKNCESLLGTTAGLEIASNAKNRIKDAFIGVMPIRELEQYWTNS